MDILKFLLLALDKVVVVEPFCRLCCSSPNPKLLQYSMGFALMLQRNSRLHPDGGAPFVVMYRQVFHALENPSRKSAQEDVLPDEP
jgi:hypothetical protein